MGVLLQSTTLGYMITDLLLIERINTDLKARFRVLDGRPVYRIIWSADQFETRIGMTKEFYGEIFLREYWTQDKRPKYWYFKNPCWVLEKLVFIKGVAALKEIVAELPECANGSYEPIFPFVDKDFNALPVSLPVVEIVIWKLQNPTKPLTPSQLDDLRVQLEDKEVEYFEEQLGQDERSPLFVAGNAVNVSTNQMQFKKEFIEK